MENVLIQHFRSIGVKPFTNPSLILQGGHLLTFFSFLTKPTLPSAICSSFSIIQCKTPQISILKAESLNWGFRSLRGANNKLHCHLCKLILIELRTLTSSMEHTDQISTESGSFAAVSMYYNKEWKDYCEATNIKAFSALAQTHRSKEFNKQAQCALVVRTVL